MQNVCIPLFEDGDHVTGQVTAPVNGKRFIKVSADMPSGPGVSDATDGGMLQVAQCGAGDDAIGVSEWDALSVGDKVGIIGEPGMYVPVLTGAAIAAGQQVQSDALGRAIPLAAGKPLGTCVSGAANAAEAFIKLRV